MALVASSVLVLRPTTIRSLAESDARVTLALLYEVSDRVHTYIEVASGQVFSSLRERIAAHLLDMAEVLEGAPAELLAPISQQGLADATGTVREVIVRILRDLRARGVLRTGREGIVIVDPIALAAETGWPSV